MTISPQPWSFRLMGGNSQRAEVLDASGKTIAHFLDARDAELIVSWTQSDMSPALMQERIDELEADLAEIRKGQD